MLLARDARTRPYFAPRTVKEWLDTPGTPRRGVKIWLLLTMEVWLRATE
jgi:hypothetical protein